MKSVCSEQAPRHSPALMLTVMPSGPENRTVSAERFLQQIQSLPPEARREVQDFVAFLRARYGRGNRRRGDARGPLREEPFVGMWRKRLDLVDSSSWVRKTRQQQWKLRGA